MTVISASAPRKPVYTSIKHYRSRASQWWTISLQRNGRNLAVREADTAGDAERIAWRLAELYCRDPGRCDGPEMF